MKHYFDFDREVTHYFSFITLYFKINSYFCRNFLKYREK